MTDEKIIEALKQSLRKIIDFGGELRAEGGINNWPEFEKSCNDADSLLSAVNAAQAEQAPVLNVADERAAFEKAMNAARFFPVELCFTRTKSPSGRDEYANSHLQSCWEGWQARAALSQPIAKDEPHCTTCQGNDANMPCAYPSKGMAGCLRDARFAKDAPVAYGDRLGTYFASVYAIPKEGAPPWMKGMTPLYTRPQPQEPVSDAEIVSLWRQAQDQGVSGIAPSIWFARALLSRKPAEGGKTDPAPVAVISGDTQPAERG